MAVKRSIRVVAWCRPQEAERIKQNAEKAGKPVAEFLRDRAMMPERVPQQEAAA